MNENDDVQLIVSETTRICQEWVIILTFQDTDNMCVYVDRNCDVFALWVTVAANIVFIDSVDGVGENISG